ncbi:MAG: UPF0175 family protein [Candidatus Competibacteraceae bacterium]|nr:UPF0175 family protein [Candidatus Competibacteraceae bacterium]
MRTLGIKELKTHPSRVGSALDAGELVLITRRGEPIGLATAFDERVLDLGLKPWLALKAFQSGDLSLGQLARVFAKSKAEMMQVLGDLGIAVVEYDLNEDIETLDSFT